MDPEFTFTLLSLPIIDRRIISNNVESISSLVQKFFGEKILNFCLINPGKWGDHPNESDGTVIALGRKEDNNNKIVSLSS
jgi:hypothetical protein